MIKIYIYQILFLRTKAVTFSFFQLIQFNWKLKNNHLKLIQEVE